MRKTIAIAFALVAGWQSPAHSGTKDVNVVNTPGVSVTNTPSVAVTNTPSVDITNTNLPATVQNDTANPVPVETTAPQRIPFQVDVSDLSSGTGSKILDFEFPDGTDRFVIEHVSARILLSSSADGIRDIVLTTTTEGATASHYLVTGNFRDDTGLGDIYIVSQNLRLYVDPDTLVRLLVTASPIGSVSVSAEMSLSGYLVPVGAQSFAP